MQMDQLTIIFFFFLNILENIAAIMHEKEKQMYKVVYKLEETL